MPMIAVNSNITRDVTNRLHVAKGGRSGVAGCGCGAGMGMGDTAVAPTATNWLEDLISGWSKTGQQVVLAQNPIMTYTTDANGTRVYTPIGGITGAGAAITSSAQSVTTMAAIAAVGLGVVWFLMKR